MSLERTISIIKPDAVSRNVIGEIYQIFEKAGLRIAAAKMKHLSREKAEASMPCIKNAHSSMTWLSS